MYRGLCTLDGFPDEDQIKQGSRARREHDRKRRHYLLGHRIADDRFTWAAREEQTGSEVPYLLSGLSLSLKHRVNTTSRRSRGLLTEQAFDRIPFGLLISLFVVSRICASNLSHIHTHARTHAFRISFLYIGKSSFRISLSKSSLGISLSENSFGMN